MARGVYQCRVAGCPRMSTYFAVGNVARYGHVCTECWVSFGEAERSLYSVSHSSAPPPVKP